MENSYDYNEGLKDKYGTSISYDSYTYIKICSRVNRKNLANIGNSAIPYQLCQFMKRSPMQQKGRMC